MKSRGHGQPPAGEPALSDELLGGLDGIQGAGDHHLPGRVVIGHHQVAPLERIEQRLNVLDGGRDGDHPAGQLAGRGHQRSSFSGHPQVILCGQRPGRVKRRHFAEAVAGHRLGLDPQGVQHCQLRHARCADGRLSPLGGTQQRIVSLTLLFVKARDGEDHLVQSPPMVQRHVRCLVPGSACRIKGHRQLGAHAHVLAPLPGEDEGQPTLPLWSHAIDAAIGVHKGAQGLPGDDLCQPQELLTQVFCRRCDHRQPRISPRVMAVRALPGDPPEHLRPLAAGHQGRGLLGQGCPTGCTQGDQLHGQRAETRGPCCRALIFLQRDMKIGSPEAKRADTCPPRVIARSDPWPGKEIEIESRILECQLGVRLLHLDGGRQDLVVQGHNDLEESCSARRRLGMANLRFDRSESTPLGAGFILHREDLAQTSKLRCVAGLRPGPVGLYQLHGLRLVASVVISPPQGLGLPLRHRCIDALGVAVRAGAHAGDHRIYPISILLGAFQSFEGHHPQPFSQHGAVGLVREGAAIASQAQGRSLAEA